MQNQQNVSQHAARSQGNPKKGDFGGLPRIHVPAMTGAQLGEMLLALKAAFG